MKKALLLLILFLFLPGMPAFGADPTITPTPTIPSDPYLNKQTPVYQWTKTIGEIENGIAVEYFMSVAIDSKNNVYTSGYFQNTVDFDPTAKQEIRKSSGSGDVFLTKYSSDGTYLWTKTFGGISFDYGAEIRIDSKDNIYLGGSWGDGTVDFNPEKGGAIKSSGGHGDPFIVKYDANANFQWVKTATGPFNDPVTDMALDKNEDILYAGYISSGLFNFNPDGIPLTYSAGGNHDICFAKYASDGTVLWGKGLGVGGDELGYAVTSNSNNDVYVSGIFQSPIDFDASGGSDVKSNIGGYDVFLTKYSSSGGYLWTKVFGGSGTDYGYSLATDSKDNIYLGGFFPGTVDFDPSQGIDYKKSNGVDDVYISKYDRDGNYIWTKTFGSPQDDSLSNVQIDRDDNIYVFGSFSGTADFDPSLNEDLRTSNGLNDAFLAKFDSDGNYQWTVGFGGELADSLGSLAIDHNYGIYVVGAFDDIVDFDPSAGVNSITSTGGTDGYISKFTYPTNTTVNKLTITVPNDNGVVTGGQSTIANYKIINFSVAGLIPKWSLNKTVPNRMQVHMANGDNVGLEYQKIEDGNYIWEGKYRIVNKNNDKPVKGTVEGIVYQMPIGNTTHFSALSPGLVNVGATFDFEIKAASAGAYLFNNATDSASVIYTANSTEEPPSLFENVIASAQAYISALIARFLTQ